MNKLYLFLAFAAIFAVASAIGGVKDLAGNYYDYTTGQVASSTTGKVYNYGVPLHHYQPLGYAGYYYPGIGYYV